MLLPVNCPCAWYRPIPRNERETIACCRAHDPFPAPDEEGKRSLCRRTGEEVCRFRWASSFHGDATVHVSPQGEEIAMWWDSRPLVDHTGPGTVPLNLQDWRRVHTAVGVASFWSLDPDEVGLGLDDATWTIEGRRRDSFQAVKRWSPEEGGLRDLGRLLFELAGPRLARVKLY